MPLMEMKPGIYWIGVNDRTTDLFEGLWPVTENGVSYNAYLINDEKKAIIDLVKAEKTDEFLEQIETKFPVSELDYIIVNHMEPDHSGVLKTMKRIAPNAEIIGTEKTKSMLEAYFGITERVRVVSDGESLSLGKKQLKFFSTPFVHWPETMMTYESNSGILFSCDAFGSYGVLRGAIFDDCCKEIPLFESEALRYYVNIVSTFSGPVLRAIKKLADVDVRMIAPSHGLIWRHNPGRIVDLYKKWAQYATGPTEKGVTLVYGSMYGNTESMMNAVAQGISRTGLPLHIHDVARTHVSYILPSLWRYEGVIIGAPTYEGKLFPPMVQLLSMAGLKRVFNKKAAYFGSWGWSKGALKQTGEMIDSLKWDLVDALEFNGKPGREGIKEGEAFGEKFGKLLLSDSE